MPMPRAQTIDARTRESPLLRDLAAGDLLDEREHRLPVRAAAALELDVHVVALAWLEVHREVRVGPCDTLAHRRCHDDLVAPGLRFYDARRFMLAIDLLDRGRPEVHLRSRAEVAGDLAPRRTPSRGCFARRCRGQHHYRGKRRETARASPPELMTAREHLVPA